QARADCRQGPLIRPFVRHHGQPEVFIPTRRGQQGDLVYEWPENLHRSQNQRPSFQSYQGFVLTHAAALASRQHKAVDSFHHAQTVLSGPVERAARFLPDLYKLPSETSLNTEIAMRHTVLCWGTDFDNFFVLNMEGHRTPHSAVRADGVRRGLARFIPGPGLAHAVFAHKHQRSRRTHPDAVPTVDAGGIRKGDRVLRGNARIEAAAGHGNGEGILSVGAARFHTLVAKDTLAVVPQIEIIVDLDRLRDCGSLGSVRGSVETRPRRVAIVGRRLLRSKAFRTGAVPLDICQNLGRGRNVHRGGEEFQDQPTAETNPFRIGSDHHAVLGLARAGGNERPRTFQLDNTDAADVDRRERFKEAERWRIDARLACRLEQRAPFGHRYRPAVDGHAHLPPGGCRGHDRKRASGNGNQDVRRLKRKWRGGLSFHLTHEFLLASFLPVRGGAWPCPPTSKTRTTAIGAGRTPPH